MSFHLTNHSHTTSTYTLNNSALQTSTTCKDLGVHFSPNLSWSTHYSKISAKAYCALNLIRRTFGKNLPQHCKRKLYVSLVLPHLLYCSQVWRPHLIKDIVMLERIQRRATKFILNYNGVSYKESLISLSLLPLMYQFELNDILLYVSYLKTRDLCHLPFMDKLSRNSNVATRSATHAKLHHSCSHDHSFASRLPRLWNSIPCIDTTQSYATIKKAIHQYLWSHFISSFDQEIPCSFHAFCPCNRCSSFCKLNFNPI